MVKSAQAAQATTIWTIGHSTRPIEEFVALLQTFEIETIADVRRFPGSRNCPQFGQQALQVTLAAHAIGYAWLETLGGRRRASPDSPNIAWRNAAFRGYADYMASATFAQGMTQLLELASASRTALMCAESVWWRCHRALIADALCVRGIEVIHVLDMRHSTVHPMTQPARIVDGRLTYAVPEQQTLL
jgi:uncharacterized protein (DUF488 family)